MYPALAIVDELRARNVKNEQLLWVGTRGQMEEELVPRANIPLATIHGGPIAGVSRLNQIKNGAKLARGGFEAWQLLGKFRPDVVFLTGGYVNLPVAWAAKLRGIPSVIYLPDVEPGSAIKRLAPLATKIGCTTEGSRQFLPPEKLVVTGYPVRASLRAALSMSVEEARKRFDLAADRPTVFVFGGSRGAQSINQGLTAILPNLLAVAQVIHISGTLTWNETEAAMQALPPELKQWYRPYPYLHDEMGAAFRSADVVIARAGASMLGECPAFGLPAILIPYPHAWRYQKVNADYLVDHDAGIRLDDSEIASKLLTTVVKLLGMPHRLAEMKVASQKLDRPNATIELANLLEEIANNHKQRDKLFLNR